MGSRFVRGALLATVGLLGAGLAACTPAVTIVVTTTSPGPDHAPGDDVCEVTPGAGNCSLQAAVDEANAQPSAAITVPAGLYEGMDLVVTGNVHLNWRAPQNVRLSRVTIDVAVGGHLKAHGLITEPTEFPDEGDPIYHPVQLTVAGVLQLRGSTLANVDQDPLQGVALSVLPGGQARVEDSILFGGAHAIDNEGSVSVVRSGLFNFVSGVINTSGDGVSKFQASILSRAVNTAQLTTTCSGTGGTSRGYNFYGRSGGGCTHAPTDLSQLAIVIYGGAGFNEPPAAAVDAIPIGRAGCSLAAVDLAGQPRGVDGNGDGIPGCDIGAYERQP